MVAEGTGERFDVGVPSSSGNGDGARNCGSYGPSNAMRRLKTSLKSPSSKRTTGSGTGPYRLACAGGCLPPRRTRGRGGEGGSSLLLKIGESFRAERTSPVLLIDITEGDRLKAVATGEIKIYKVERGCTHTQICRVPRVLARSQMKGILVKNSFRCGR
jgi:hypothetical protein